MKTFNIILAALLVSGFALGQVKVQEQDAPLFGENFEAKEVLNAETMAGNYANLKVGDSLTTLFRAPTVDVCKAKGCWMRLQLDSDNEVLVKFKDYGFFVPTDLDGNEVIVKGKAFVEELSVEEQRHYAQDAGKSEEEVSKIVSPKRTLRFEATGVLVEN